MPSFFMIGADEKLEGNKLVELNGLIDWCGIRKHQIEIHKNDVDPQGILHLYEIFAQNLQLRQRFVYGA
jgi:hypothetical protein